MGKLAPALAFIKKNFLSLLCGIIALAAVIGWKWPIGGWYETLQTEADARKTAYTTLTGLMKKPRSLPVLDPLSPEAKPLEVFPTETIIARGTTVTKAVHDESEAMMQAATDMAVHKPLISDALPNGGTRAATTFLRAYQQFFPVNVTPQPGFNPQGMPPAMGGPGSPTPADSNVNKNTLSVTILKAGMPPSDAEIKQEQDDIKTQITNEKSQKDASGKIVNGPAVAAEILADQLALPDSLKNAAAANFLMYIAPDAYHQHPQLTGVNPPSAVTMFNGQMSLWLLQDVFKAIASANADSKDGVRTSRIKHLIKIDYQDAPLGQGVSPDSGAPGGAAAAPSADPLHPTVDKTKSPTGHVSNALYDVVPFSLKIIVDAESVPDVLLALSRNRFITVLRVDMLSVDSGQALQAGFIYGDKQVVQLNIAAEELFFRSDTVPWMPDPIKRGLGVAPPPAGTPGT